MDTLNNPVNMGGSLGRGEATGLGAFLVIEFLRNKEGMAADDISVVIQNFGNAGYNVAKLLQEVSYKIVAISDSKGAIYLEKGLDVENVKKCKDKHKSLESNYCDGSVCETLESVTISHEEHLALDVDLLISAALENTITKENVKSVKAKWIAEVSNGPISAGANKILHEKGIVIVPDVLTNAGGVIVSGCRTGLVNHGHLTR